MTVPTIARARPGAGPIVTRVGARARWNGGPVGLLVVGTRTAPDGRLWLKVPLPMRPSGTRGWIPADAAKLARTPYRIEVSTGRRTVRLLQAGRIIMSTRAVVGTPNWPTPLGLHAVAERVAQPDSNGFLGPWALHLTARSRALLDYGGGPGTVAIHGRGGESFNDPLGTARSHGCVRIDNAVVRLLARVAREGTPVRITP